MKIIIIIIIPTKQILYVFNEYFSNNTQQINLNNVNDIVNQKLMKVQEKLNKMNIKMNNKFNNIQNKFNNQMQNKNVIVNNYNNNSK